MIDGESNIAITLPETEEDRVRGVMLTLIEFLSIGISTVI